MLTLAFLVVLLCGCNNPVISDIPPSHGMGVRYTERGLEKFCQKGYAIVPDILAQMRPFEITGISFGGFKISLLNVRVRTVTLATMKIFLHENGRIKMEARGGFMQLSMRVEAGFSSLSGAADVIFSLNDFGADLSARIGDDPSCPFHFGLFEFANQVYMSSLNLDAIGLDAIGEVVANMLQTMIPSLESLLRTTILQSLLDVILQSIREIMLGVPPVSRKGDYRTDQRYINGINIIDKKIVADLGGYSYIAYPGGDTPASERYPIDISSPPPKTVYSNKDYELYFDREAINSYLHTWQSFYSTYSLSGLSIAYGTLKAAKIPGLAEALVEAGILTSESDIGKDITLSLSVQLTSVPHIPWLGAAGLPVYFNGIFNIAAQKGTENKSIMELEGTALIVGSFHLNSYNVGFNSDRAYGYIALEDLISLTATRIECNYAKLDTDELARYMISERYIPEANRFLGDPGIVLINGNFVNYSTAAAIYFPAEDRVLFVADIVGNPHFS